MQGSDGKCVRFVECEHNTLGPINDQLNEFHNSDDDDDDYNEDTDVEEQPDDEESDEDVDVFYYPDDEPLEQVLEISVSPLVSSLLWISNDLWLLMCVFAYRMRNAWKLKIKKRTRNAFLFRRRKCLRRNVKNQKKCLRLSSKGRRHFRRLLNRSIFAE